jgi:hypothetical protein
MNAAQILPFAAAAGFTGQDLATAVAIALAESSGNPTIYNPETAAKGGTPVGQGSYGLWQIYLRDHPEFAQANLYDPATNAAAAFSLYAHSGFTPWATSDPPHGNGAYRSYLPGVLSAMQAAAPAPAQPQPPITIDASTGQVVPDVSAAFMPTIDASLLPGAGSTWSPPLTTTSPSFGQILLYAALGLAALWIFEEAA